MRPLQPTDEFRYVCWLAKPNERGGQIANDTCSLGIDFALQCWLRPILRELLFRFHCAAKDRHQI